jgi:hypothetical protein
MYKKRAGGERHRPSVFCRCRRSYLVLKKAVRKLPSRVVIVAR